MSNRYRKVDAYECAECGELYDHPSLAEKCAKGEEMLRVAREIAELRIRGGICEGEHENSKLEVGVIIDRLKQERDELEEQYGDDCDHGEHMKDIVVDGGGIYCHTCDDMVNEYPKNPQTLYIGPSKE